MPRSRRSSGGGRKRASTAAGTEGTTTASVGDAAVPPETAREGGSDASKDPPPRGSASSPVVWELPDCVLFYIVSFVAPPTQRASVICHQIAPICLDARDYLVGDGGERSSVLWETILKEDYGSIKECDPSTMSDSPTSQRSGRRSCKRLRRSPIYRVRDAHKLMKDNTEIAFFYLSEMTNNPATAGNKKLSRGRLCGLLDTYGPHLRLNNPVSSGGTYLVEVCRARRVKESTILQCVGELVEKRGALVNVLTNESNRSYQSPLCVASARGMSKVVKYLLQAGADRNARCCGRFRLYTQPKRTIKCTNMTPFEFAVSMRDAEMDSGASNHDLTNLNKCIKLLKE